MKILLVGLVGILLAFPFGQELQFENGQPSSSQALNRIDRVGEANARAFFVFSTSAGAYAIRHDGFSELTPPAAKRLHFNLRMAPNARVERVCMAEWRGDLLLAYELSPTGGYILRVNQKSMKLKWLTPLHGRNLGPGLIDADGIYLTSKNLIAKIDLNSGAYLWEDGELDKETNQPIEQFRVPVIKVGAVVFEEDGKEPRGRVVEVEKVTGRIVKIS